MPCCGCGTSKSIMQYCSIDGFQAKGNLYWTGSILIKLTSCHFKFEIPLTNKYAKANIKVSCKIICINKP